jgi:thiol:disulfide interchange protein
MKHALSRYLLQFLLLLGTWLWMQQTTFAQFKQHLFWKSEVEKISGNEYRVKIICTLDENWHTYSQFTADGGPLPTQFRFEKNPGIELLGKVEEIGQKETKFDELFGVDVTTFKSDPTFIQRIRLQDLKAVLKGEFDGMVCKDEEGCMPFGPEILEIRFDGIKTEPATDTAAAGTVSPPTDTANRISVIIPSSKFDTTHINNACSVKSESKDRSYWLVFLLGFLGGLVALLTPCVFPMVPLTVSFFTKGGKDKKQGIRKALTYGVSIVVIYVLLGIIITGVFGSDALNAMSTNIWFNLLFFVVFVVFAFSFFGFFEITLPASWANKTDSLASKGGNIGIFFMAFTLALVSFSCTGPIIGTLLVQAATGGGPALFGYIPLKPLLGMFGFSLALALPFTLFALFPQWLHSLPKSGGWMNTVKIILGFLELALAFKFLSVVDMTQNWGLLRWEPFLIIWGLIFIGMSLYCFGIIRFPHDEKNEKPGIIRITTGLFSLAFVAYLGYGLISYKPLKLLSGLAPPSTYNFLAEQSEAFRHFTDYDEGLAYAKAHNMPVLLDFTGFGCVNCRKVEEHVWTDVQIAGLLKKYVVISLYVDDRKALPESAWYRSSATGKEREIKTIGQKWSDFQAKHFQTNSQPYYVLINPQEQLLNYPVDYQFSSNVKNYESFLSCGLKMHNEVQ